MVHDKNANSLPRPPWERTRRRRAAARAPLSRDDIVTAALAIVDREGLEATSMRAVAGELGVAPSALYWHVRSKHELLELVLDRAIGEIELPEPDPAGWQEQLRDLAREMRRVRTRHRDLAHVQVGAIPIGPNRLRVVEWTYALLREAGLPDPVVVNVPHLLGRFVEAHAGPESADLASPTGEQLLPEEVTAMIRGYWETLPAERFPHTRALGDALLDVGPDERFELGLDVIVRGLATLAAETPPCR